MFIVFTSKVGLLVACLELFDPVVLCSGWALVNNNAFDFLSVDFFLLIKETKSATMNIFRFFFNFFLNH